MNESLRHEVMSRSRLGLLGEEECQSKAIGLADDVLAWADRENISDIERIIDEAKILIEEHSSGARGRFGSKRAAVRTAANIQRSGGAESLRWLRPPRKHND